MKLKEKMKTQITKIRCFKSGILITDLKIMRWYKIKSLFITLEYLYKMVTDLETHPLIQMSGVEITNKDLSHNLHM
jgi:hypothetical protein